MPHPVDDARTQLRRGRLRPAVLAELLHAGPEGLTARALSHLVDADSPDVEAAAAELCADGRAICHGRFADRRWTAT